MVTPNTYDPLAEVKKVLNRPVRSPEVRSKPNVVDYLLFRERESLQYFTLGQQLHYYEMALEVTVPERRNNQDLIKEATNVLNTIPTIPAFMFKSITIDYGQLEDGNNRSFVARFILEAKERCP